MTVNKNIAEHLTKDMQLAQLNEGDKVRLLDGSIAKFVRLKQKNFIGVIGDVSYNINIKMFAEVVEKVDVHARAIEQEVGYSTLKKDELFFINRKSDIMIFRFSEIKNGKIVGMNPITNVKTRIDTALYGGKVSDL